MNLSPLSDPSPGLILDLVTPAPRHRSRRLGSMPQVSASDQEQISDSSSPWCRPPTVHFELLCLHAHLCSGRSYLVNLLSLYLSIDSLERKSSGLFAWMDLRYRGLLARV